MNLTILASTTVRILNQLRHDRRTIAMLVVVPVLLLTLLYYIFSDVPGVFDRVGLIMLGVFPFVIMFLITSIAMLRERTTGTLERLLTTPMNKLDLLFGYGIAFGIAAAIQASVAAGVAYWLFDLDTAGNNGLGPGLPLADALPRGGFGVFLSPFARHRFQARPFLP